MVVGVLITLGTTSYSQVTPLRFAPTRSTAGFTRVSELQAGLEFTNRVAPERYLTNQIYLNGSGVALGDMNGDQRPDIFLAAPDGLSAVFLNQGGWKFTRSNDALPASQPGLDATGVVLADLDGDVDLDALVNTVAQGTHVWLNDGQGRFRAMEAPLNVGHAGMSLALADADADGDLDLYVTNYRPTTIRDDPAGKFTLRHEPTGPRVVAYNGRSTSEPDLVGRFYVTPAGVKENGEPDVLFLNDGQGHFSAVRWTGGAFVDESGQPLVAPPYDWGLSVLFRDLNDDGRPDLYLSNDFESPDRFWINESARGGPLRFRAAPARSLRHTSAFAMGADAADVNRDGHTDFLVLDMLSRAHLSRNQQVDNLPPSRHQPGEIEERFQFSANSLFLGRGNGTYAELGRLTGLAASEWSWTPVFLDVDLDGWEDLLVSNGHELDMMDADLIQQAERMKNQRRMPARELLELRKLFPRLATPNVAFRNRGNLAFSDESASWGFDTRNVTQGMALADLDGDGDLDIVQNNLNAPPTLLRNEASAPRVAVRAHAAGGNTRGIGARIRVRGGPVPEQSQVLMCGGRYLSSDDPMRVFAAGLASTLTVEVHWPSGRQTVVKDVPPNSLVDVVEASDSPVVSPVTARTAPLMVDVSVRLNHVAGETAFNDFERQPLLPWSLAYPTPGATWADLDGTAPDELLIGTGAGGTPAIFQVVGQEFRRLTNASWLRPVARELTTLLASGRTVLAGSSNYRDGQTNGGVLRLYDLDREVTGESLLGQAFGVGPLAMAEVDAEGTLELFVGGRAQAGRYPEPATSLLLKSVQGRFSVAQRFPDLGLVNSATFADLDDDGDPDLLVALEWGPLRVLQNNAGAFTDWDVPLKGADLPPTHARLSALSGWWTSVAVGDFDADGRLDVIAGNRGWNWFPVPRAPQSAMWNPANRRRIHFGDISGQGPVELLESYFDGGRELPLRRADILFGALPQLRDVFPTRAALGGADLRQVLAALKLPRELAIVAADWFATTVFLNRGDHFEVRALPIEAQFAPVAGLAVADFDGDGNQDVFMAQNFLPVRPDEAPQDAGCGLLLRGDGRGSFAAMPVEESGMAVWGDARAAAVGDFDLDGRPDLVVTQNGGPTRLFQNRGGRPGLRVRLVGSPENPTGIGTHLRLHTATESGPIQEVQAGTGWLSVDSPQRILTARQPGTQLEVRWPGKLKVFLPLPAGIQDIQVSIDGTTQVLR